MDKKKNDKQKVISLLRAKIENPANLNAIEDGNITDQELSVLLSELQIFQLELEMQNDELSASYQMLEQEKSKFAGFFNLAPVGYFILDQLGVIEEANQTGANLFQIGKQAILGKRFQSFIDAEAWDSFYAFLRKMQITSDKQSTEIKLLLVNGTVIFTRMEGIAIPDPIVHKIQYYITVIDITEQIKLAKKAQELVDEKQKLVLSTTLNAQEKERYKISNVLHDSVCQLLYGIKMNFQNIHRTYNFKNEFKNINLLLDQAICETRELSYELTPSVLRDFGFIAGVKEMASRLSTPQFQINTFLKKSAERFPKEVQLYIFRIIQELINNCIKHSEATTAEIIAYMEADWIILVISDNGRGFSSSVDQLMTKGSGLRGIKSRVFLLNGSMDVNTSGQGTIVTVKFKNDQRLLELA